MKTSILRSSLRQFALGLAAIFAFCAPSLHAVTLTQAGYTDQTYGTVSAMSSSFGNLATNANGDVFAVGGFNTNLFRSVAGSGTFSSYLNMGGTALGLARAGNLLFVGVESQKIFRVDLSAVTPSAVQIGTITDTSPQALAIAPAGWGSHGGKLVIGGDYQIYVMDLSTGVATQLGNQSRPTSAIAFTADGVLLATDYNGTSIRRINPDGTSSVFRTVSSGIDGMVIHPSTGKIYTFNSSLSEIREIAADGSSDVLFATGASLNGGYYPSAAAFSPSGDRLFYVVQGGEVRFISGFPALTTLPATAITATTATLNGSTNPFGLATTAWFEWGTSPTLVGATSTSAQNVGSGTSTVAFSEPLSGLAQNTTYYFRAVMNNSGGTKYGSILSFFTGPEISVEQPAGTNLVDGAATVAFSDVAISTSSATKTFTIKNSGSLNLTGLVVTKGGSHPGDFTVSALGDTTVAPGGSTTFTVSVTPGALGARSATIHIASYDADENPFDINLTANGVETLTIIGGSDLLTPPDVVQLQTWLGEGTLTLTKVFSTAPGDGKTSTNFHAAVDGIGRTFTVIELPAQGPYGRKVIGGYNPQSWSSINNYNTTFNDAQRTAFLFNLTTGLLQRQKLNSNPNGSVGQYPTYNSSSYGPTFGAGHDLYMDSSLRAGYAYNYSYGPNIGGYGTSIADGGQGSSLTYARMEVFTISVAPPAPEIVVEQPLNTNLADGGTKDFGTVSVGSSTNLTFTIKNTGNSNLTGLTITKDGAHAGDFTITASPTAPVSGPSGSTTFTVQFTPGAAGTRTAAIHIANNDSNEHPFDINLTGFGNTPPTFAGPYPVSTAYQTAAPISLGKLLTRAADADGHSVSVTAVSPASAQGGTVVLGSSILYTPPNGFSGADSFTVTITDSLGATVQGTVAVTVGANPNGGGQGVNPPQLTMISGGDVGISFQGIPGRSYQIQRSPDLSPGSWQTIATVVAASNGAVTFTDESPPPGSAYYRMGIP